MANFNPIVPQASQGENDCDLVPDDVILTCDNVDEVEDQQVNLTPQHNAGVDTNIVLSTETATDEEKIAMTMKDSQGGLQANNPYSNDDLRLMNEQLQQQVKQQMDMIQLLVKQNQEQEKRQVQMREELNQQLEQGLEEVVKNHQLVKKDTEVIPNEEAYVGQQLSVMTPCKIQGQENVNEELQVRRELRFKKTQEQHLELEVEDNKKTKENQTHRKDILQGIKLNVTKCSEQETTNDDDDCILCEVPQRGDQSEALQNSDLLQNEDGDKLQNEYQKENLQSHDQNEIGVDLKQESIPVDIDEEIRRIEQEWGEDLIEDELKFKQATMDIMEEEKAEEESTYQTDSVSTKQECPYKIVEEYFQETWQSLIKSKAEYSMQSDSEDCKRTMAPMQVTIPVQNVVPISLARNKAISQKPNYAGLDSEMTKEIPTTSAGPSQATVRKRPSRLRTAVAKEYKESSTESSENEDEPITRKQRQSSTDQTEKAILRRKKTAIIVDRCRRKRKQWLQNLQKEVKEMDRANRKLEAEAKRLRDKILLLKTFLLTHKDCPVTKMQILQRQSARARGSDAGSSSPGSSTECIQLE